MSSVDDRIVNMQFNNRQFESGVTQSTRSLSGLESALAKSAQSKGLAGMAAGVDGVKKKFSIMQVAGVTAVATIANKAVNAGINLVKSLTIDPLLQGWDEYNTNLKSIQTVMANTGKGIKPVQAALQQLNKYSDQTIYNFSEMAKNVGTFSAAGVGLKTSVSAIKGIANIAALSGSSSQQASTAMYQLSQAIAAGRVNLQDWNSVVNAGMGGKNLQSALIRTGISMGKIDAKTVTWGKNIKIAGESFRSSISAKGGKEAWLGSDVLVKTLALMDGRLSKTAITAKIFAKNQKLASDQQLNSTQINKKANVELEKQQKLMKKQGFSPKDIQSMTKMANAAYESATVVKTLPQLLGVVKESIGSVWANAFTGIIGNFSQSKKLWTAASNSISKSIQGFSMGLNNVIVGWKKGGGRIAVIESFKNGFSAIGKILGAVKMAFRDVFPPGAGSALASFSKGFRDFTAALIPSAGTLEKLRSIFGGVFAVLHIGFTIVKAITGVFFDLFHAIFQSSGPATGGILSMVAAVAEAIKGFDKWLSSGTKIKDLFSLIGRTIGPVFQPLIDGIKLVGIALGNLISGGGISGFMAPFNDAKGKFADFGNTVYNAVNKIAQPLGGLSNIFNKIKSALSGLKPALSGIGGALGSAFSNIPGADIAKNIVMGIVVGLGGAALGLLKSAAIALANMIPDSIKHALGINSPAYKLIPVGINVVKGIVVGIMQAIPEILKGAGHILSAVISGIGAMAGPIAKEFNQLFGHMNALDWASTINAIFTTLLLFGTGKVIKTVVDFKKAFNDVIKGVTGSLSAMQGALKAQTLKAIAIAVALLVGSIIALSFIDPKKIAISLGAIAVMMALLVKSMQALSKIASGDVNIALIAASIALISGAMINLAVAVAILGNLDLSTLAKGLGAMAIVMAIMTKSMQGLAALGPGLPAAAFGIAIVSGAMVVLAAAVLAFGSMDLGTLAKGIGAMALAMNVLTGAMSILVVLGPGVAAAGAGILMASTAMVVLAAAVLAFGNMDIATLAVGIGAIAFVLAIFTASLGLLGEVGPGVIAAGAAMVLMAAAMNMLVPVIALLGSMDISTLAKGIGAMAAIMAVAAIGLAAFGVVATIFGGALFVLGAALALAGAGMFLFGAGFALLAVTGVAGVAVLVVAFHAFMALLPALAVQMAAAFVSFLKTLAKAAPQIRAAMNTIFKNMLGVVTDNIPRLAKMMTIMINYGIAVLRNAVPKFIELGFLIIDRFLQSALKHAPSIIDSVTKLVITFINGISAKLPRIIDAGVKLIISFVHGLAQGINKNVDAMRRAGLELAGAIINGMTGGLLGKGIQMVKDAAARVANSIPGPIKKILGIASPSKEAYWWGEMIGAGLAGGLMASIKLAVGAAVKMANAVIGAGDDSVIAAQDKAREAQAKADQELAASEASKFSATKIRGNSASAKHKRKVATNLAAKQKKSAEQAQTKADAAAEAVTKAQEFAAADLAGKGKIQSDKAEADAATAARLLAKASSEAAAAQRLKTTNRAASIALTAMAKADAAAAAKYATTAENYRTEAAQYYASEVNDRIKTLEETRAAEEQAIIDQAQLDAADAQGKADILTLRAQANQAKADASAAEAKRLIEEAKALASTNAKKAMELLDEAEKQSALAKEAADEAKRQQDEAKQALGQNTASGPDSPSRSVLEDAARVVDRYTASLAAASEAAQATPQPIQYTQNNYSPEALPVSTIYRQGKNLLSLQEVKMGVPVN